MIIYLLYFIYYILFIFKIFILFARHIRNKSSMIRFSLVYLFLNTLLFSSGGVGGCLDLNLSLLRFEFIFVFGCFLNLYLNLVVGDESCVNVVVFLFLDLIFRTSKSSLRVYVLTDEPAPTVKLDISRGLTCESSIGSILSV